MKIKNDDLGVRLEDEHYFILDISENIKIYETYNSGHTKQLKASTTKNNWNLIKDNILMSFKKSLQEDNYKINRIHIGENKINIQLAKELIILLWGIESIEDGNNIQIALRNWNGFERAERWYLYTMTNANLNANKNKGWRGAIKKILIEN